MTLPLKSYKDMCDEIGFYTFGTIFIFEKKKKYYSRLTNCMIILGVCVPIISYFLLSDLFQNSPQIASKLKLIFYSLGLLQVLMSIISLACKWEDKKAHADKAIEKNKTMNTKSIHLSQTNIINKTEEILELWREFKHQETLDTGMISVSRKEAREAMTYTLYNLDLSCAKCKSAPTKLSLPTFGPKCDCCGQNI